MNEIQTAWAAGILEGEGCFDYNRLPKYPRVRVEMTDIDVIEKMQDVLGVGRISYTDRHGWKPTAILTISGKDAIPVMRAVLPHMGVRRKAKIEGLLASVREVC